MDNLMPSYSFSHQFYRHWTQTPETVRAAIVQELTDIATLLQTDTSTQVFEFSIPDLDTHIDELYHAHRAQEAATQARADKAKAEQARLEKEQMDKAQAAKAEQDKIAKAKVEKEQAEAKAQQEQQEQAKKAYAEKEAAAQAQQEAAAPEPTQEAQPDAPPQIAKSDDAKQPESTKDDQHRTAENNQAAATDTPKITAPASSADKETAAPKLNAPLSERHEDLIQELGAHIDDYLSEQMTQLSEDLKSWLRAEISRQLADKAQ